LLINERPIAEDGEKKGKEGGAGRTLLFPFGRKKKEEGRIVFRMARREGEKAPNV